MFDGVSLMKHPLKMTVDDWLNLEHEEYEESRWYVFMKIDSNFQGDDEC